MPAPLASPAVLWSWIEALERYPSRELTSWEEGFVLSVRVQLELRGSLSTRQIATLARLYYAETTG